ncbi:MAG: PEGA domain-containing protein [Candidatus Parabeggiatoa sp.]|nr:PEGA domain-containing protein [Candidatus Parabeggiatoa sp.]
MPYQKYGLLLLGSLFVLFSSQPAFAKCYRLNVDAIPNDAKITIWNIIPKFRQGICLPPGTYDIQVKKPGYITWRKKVPIRNNKRFRVTIWPKKYRLFVNTTQKNAKISIMNIKPKYRRGIRLTAGKYDIKVSSPGCQTHRQWIELQQDFTLPIKLACQTQHAEPVKKTLPVHTLPPIKNLEQGDYEISIFNGLSEKSFGMVTVQKQRPLTIRFTKQADCRLTTRNDGIKEIAIKGQHLLRFVPVDMPKDPTGGIDIALRYHQAEQFYRQAQQQLPPDSSPLLPLIFKAASENPVFKVIPKFWVQQEPINADLYQAILLSGSADSVSYDDATVVINQLNQWCQGTAQFKLPQEKHFVYLARHIYNPIETNELKSCRLLLREEAAAEPNRPFKKLLGYQWQLTKSHCQPFDDEQSKATLTCDEQNIVKKGGSIESRDATECMPEYRAESLADMREPNTTFRLLLLVP